MAAPSGNVSEEAQEIISQNSKYIIKYAGMYDVDPNIIENTKPPAMLGRIV